MMNKLIMCFLLSLVMSINFNKWNEEIESTSDFDKFISKCENEINRLTIDNPTIENPNKNDILKFHFYIVDAYYRNGKIEQAIKYAEDNIWNSENNDLSPIKHEPYKNKMKNCSNSKCLCRSMSDDEIFNYNLDFLSPDNLSNNFSNVWIVIGSSDKVITDDNQYEDYSWSPDISDIKNPVSIKTSVVTKKGGPIKFAILPRPYLEDIDDDIRNNQAKRNRINSLRDLYWDNSSKTITPTSYLEFIDIIEIDNEKQRINGEYVYGKHIPYYPIMSESGEDNFSDFSRLYVFQEQFNSESEEFEVNFNNYNRYSFKVSNMVGGDDFFEEVSLNDFFIYLQWQEDWRLKKYSEGDLVTLEIPKIYYDKYDIEINLNSISKIEEKGFENNNSFEIYKNRTDDQLVQCKDYDVCDMENILINSSSEYIDSDLIRITLNNQNPDTPEGVNQVQIRVREKEEIKGSKLPDWLLYSLGLIGVIVLAQ